MFLCISLCSSLCFALALFPDLSETAHSAVAGGSVHGAVAVWALVGLALLCGVWMVRNGVARRRMISDLRCIARNRDFSGRVGPDGVPGSILPGAEINRMLSVLESVHLGLASDCEGLKRENAELAGELRRTRQRLEEEISERRRAQDRSARLRSIPDFYPDVVMEFSSAGDPTYHNAAAQALAESSGYAHPDLLPPPETAGLVRKCLAEGAIQRTRASLGARTLEWRFQPVGETGVVQGVARDVTEQQRLEIEIRRARMPHNLRAQALVSANEFKNLFTIIQGYGNFVLARRDLEPALVESISQMISAAERAENLAARFAGLDSPKKPVGAGWWRGITEAAC